MIRVESLKSFGLDMAIVLSISGVLSAPFPAPGWFKAMGFSTSGLLVGSYVSSNLLLKRFETTVTAQVAERQKALDDVEQYLVEAQGELTEVKSRLDEVEMQLGAKTTELEKAIAEKESAFLHIDNLEKFITTKLKRLELTDHA